MLAGQRDLLERRELRDDPRRPHRPRHPRRDAGERAGRPRQLDDPRQDGQGDGRGDGSRGRARRRVVVIMEHAAKDGTPKILASAPCRSRDARSCTASSRTCACIDVTADGLVLREVAPGDQRARGAGEDRADAQGGAASCVTMKRLTQGPRCPGPRRKPAESDAAEKKTLGKGVFRKCDGCGETLPVRAARRQLRGVPAVRQPPQARRPRGWRKLLLDDGALEEWDAHLEPADPLEFTDGKSVPRPRRGRADGRRSAQEAIEIGRGRIDGRADRVGRVPLRLHGRVDGLGRGREDRAPVRASDRRAAARGAAPGQRRRAHAGGHPQPDADGQDGRGARAAQGRAPALPQRAAAPHHGRRRGQLRAARRREHRRARGAHRLRRARASSSRPSARSCPKASSAASSCSRTGWSTTSSAGSR